VAALAGDEALIKLTALPIEAEQTITRIMALAARSGALAEISARALNGVIYARLRPISARALGALLADLPGAQWVATALPGVPRWGAPPAGLDLMRRIRPSSIQPGCSIAGDLSRGSNREALAR